MQCFSQKNNFIWSCEKNKGFYLTATVTKWSFFYLVKDFISITVQASGEKENVIGADLS